MHQFSIPVPVGDLDPDSIQVQLYAEDAGGDGPALTGILAHSRA